MKTRILKEVAVSISELKANPMKVAQSADGDPVAVLNGNETAFYCVPAAAYERLMDHIEDLELLVIAEARKNEQAIRVDIDEL